MQTATELCIRERQGSERCSSLHVFVCCAYLSCHRCNPRCLGRCHFGIVGLGLGLTELVGSGSSHRGESLHYAQSGGCSVAVRCARLQRVSDSGIGGELQAPRCLHDR
ncbi:hypothetical protein BU24DRAFT_240211 [Aaosphaeria arxii CBS 175.79]|uniref:Uncharacterized protein n=1 Tax=Aaosphaeria arxii CBS 175.79 TaxID=1450172 RepID=A0A6A5XKZ2_9PLEO|nr:uncharacterized protein BU24DRAFT_240211 [Aaosphaeria arxii CBS 175.79]KAF2013556.1 hypothetical protein BU24DRAFT_240211 [Aaosphaeria arxii CBS 175.79]